MPFASDQGSLTCKLSCFTSLGLQNVVGKNVRCALELTAAFQMFQELTLKPTPGYALQSHASFEYEGATAGPPSAKLDMRRSKTKCKPRDVSPN